MAPELADRLDAVLAHECGRVGVAVAGSSPWSAYREPAGGYPVALRSGRMVADRDLLDGPDGGAGAPGVASISRGGVPLWLRS